jgi:hypothetical protein
LLVPSTRSSFLQSFDEERLKSQRVQPLQPAALTVWFDQKRMMMA